MNNELRSLFTAAIKSVKPSLLMKSTIRRDASKLVIRDRFFVLNHNCYLIGFGKAVYEMALEVEQMVGDHLRQGILSVPFGYQKTNLSSTIEVVEGAKNNLPDENSFLAARRIEQLVKKCGKDDLLLVLISGGGSALLSYPIAPVTLEEKTSVVKLVASAGADITELNSVRKALSQLKNGKLAILAYPATVVSFILSDIVGDPLESIASGPTVLPYVTSSVEALRILEKYNLLEQVPQSVKLVLHSPDQYQSVADTMRPHVHNIIVGNNSTSLAAISEEINDSNGFSVVLTNRVVGSVVKVAEIYSKLIEFTCLYLLRREKEKFLQEIEKLKTQFSDEYVSDIVKNLNHFTKDSKLNMRNGNTVFFISGGEPTVLVKGNGKGGRNQELSLRVGVALQELNKLREWMNRFDVHFMSGGTDGIDGPTDAAGAIVDSSLIDRALEEGLNPVQYLENNDSYSFFSKFSGGNYLIQTGHTGTNVMDVHVISIYLK